MLSLFLLDEVARENFNCQVFQPMDMRICIAMQEVLVHLSEKAPIRGKISKYCLEKMYKLQKEGKHNEIFKFYEKARLKYLKMDDGTEHYNCLGMFSRMKCLNKGEIQNLEKKAKIGIMNKEIDRSYIVKYKKEKEAMEANISKLKADSEKTLKEMRSLKEKVQELNKEKKAWDTALKNSASTENWELIDIEHIIENSSRAKVMRAFSKFKATEKFKENEEKARKMAESTKLCDLTHVLPKEIEEDQFIYPVLKEISKDNCAKILRNMQDIFTRENMDSFKKNPLLNDEKLTPKNFFLKIVKGDINVCNTIVTSPNFFPNRYAWLYTRLVERATGCRLGWTGVHNSISRAIK